MARESTVPGTTDRRHRRPGPGSIDTDIIWRCELQGMPFELRAHTADVAVEATGETLGDTFAAVADGMVAAMCDAVPEGGERVDLQVAADDVEAALFDYLDELIYLRDVRGELLVDNTATVERTDGEWAVVASARGVALDDVRAREIKAVTYSEMTVEETADGWRAYVVFDV